MTTKITIDENGEGNCCPHCSSIKIIKILTCFIVKYIRLETGKERYINPSTEKTQKMSNRIKARLYDSASSDKEYYSLKCEKCGWESETIECE